MSPEADAAERARPPEDMAPHEFFVVWVPRRVEDDARRRERLGDTRAVLEFTLLGEAGGVFTLELVEGLVKGRPGAAPAADLRVRLDVQTWRELNAGTLSAPEAFLRKRVSLDGNLRLAVQLHLILGA